jgi:hypothetical protein
MELDMKSSWIIRMGEKPHGNFAALTKDTNALITRAKAQSDKYGHVLLY